MSFTQERKEILETLRSKIQRERESYQYWEKQLANSPGVWATVGAAIEMLENYYRGEAVRAKRDIAQFMLGLEVDASYGEYHIVTDLKKDLDELPAFYDAIRRANFDLQRVAAGSAAHESARVTMEGEQGALQLKLTVIRENTKIVEREIYAG